MMCTRTVPPDAVQLSELIHRMEVAQKVGIRRIALHSHLTQDLFWLDSLRGGGGGNLPPIVYRLGISKMNFIVGPSLLLVFGKFSLHTEIPPSSDYKLFVPKVLDDVLSKAETENEKRKDILDFVIFFSDAAHLRDKQEQGDAFIDRLLANYKQLKEHRHITVLETRPANKSVQKQIDNLFSKTGGSSGKNNQASFRHQYLTEIFSHSLPILDKTRRLARLLEPALPILNLPHLAAFMPKSQLLEKAVKIKIEYLSKLFDFKGGRLLKLFIEQLLDSDEACTSLGLTTEVRVSLQVVLVVIDP